MKKILCIFLSLTMLFIFASCGGEKQEEETAPDESVSATEEVKEDENVTVPEVENESGILSSFTTETLDGKKADQSIFEGKITMVNIWATFCKPCIGEMPDLQKLHEDYSDKNFQIVGIVCDVYEENGVYYKEGLNTAKDLVEDTGVKYINLLPSADLKEAKLDEVTYIPETFFVDENGEIISESYVGSRSYEDWSVIIEDILENN